MHILDSHLKKKTLTWKFALRLRLLSVMSPSFLLFQVNTAVKHHAQHWRWCISDLTSPVIPLALLRLQSINCGITEAASWNTCIVVQFHRPWRGHAPTACPELWRLVSTWQMQSSWRYAALAGWSQIQRLAASHLSHQSVNERVKGEEENKRGEPPSDNAAFLCFHSGALRCS